MTTALPHEGDLIIHRQVHSPAVYVLSALAGPDQISHATYKDAAASATRFAQATSVVVWFTADKLRYERIAQHRPK